MSFEVIGHRGACGYAPENTLPSIRQALAMGVDAIEIDIHLSMDGIPVVIHDDTLERTTNGIGPVCAASANELKQLDAGAWYHQSFRGTQLPFLDEVLNTISARTPLVIELKGRDRVPLLVERALLSLDRHPQQKVTFSSFYSESLIEAQRQAPSIPRAWLYQPKDHPLPEALQLGAEMALQELCPHVAQVDRQCIEAMHAAGFRVRCWGLPNGNVHEMVSIMRRLVASGADGTTADYPDMMRSVALSCTQ